MWGSKAKMRRPRHRVVGACLVVILAVWIASGWITASCHLGGWFLFIKGGQFVAWDIDMDGDPWPTVRFMPAPFRWNVDVNWRAPFALGIPLWIPFLGIASSGIAREVYWRRFRKPDPGHCPCGYDLSGLSEDAPCPECGRKVIERLRG